MLDQLLAIFHDIPHFLDGFIANHGNWVYALLFGIIFAETGLVVAPFLPGDSLLFTVGAMAARENAQINIWLVSGLLLFAAVLGDAVNYHMGRFIGPRLFRKEASTAAKPTFIERALNRKHLVRAHAFFEKYGGKAVILARFVPIVRTFIPFVAGAGAMNYARFFIYNIIGAVAWVGICVAAGWFFGNTKLVQENFEAVIIAIIVISLIPMVIEFMLARRQVRKAVSQSVAQDAAKT